MKSNSLRIPFTLISLVALIPSLLLARGMPADQRDTIHGLFDAHNQFQREVTLTDDGYVSKTTSEDAEAVALVQKHVKQMEGRLKDGLMVRGWDPAYVEFVEHYDDIDIQITNIENGISIVTIGKTQEAIAVARNHAGIISKFIDRGWKEHDLTHAAVYGEESSSESANGMKGMACCQSSSAANAQGAEVCDTEGGSCCQINPGSRDQAGR